MIRKKHSFCVTVQLPNNRQVGSRPFVLLYYGGCPYTEAETKFTHNIKTRPLKHSLSKVYTYSIIWNSETMARQYI